MGLVPAVRYEYAIYPVYMAVAVAALTLLMATKHRRSLLSFGLAAVAAGIAATLFHLNFFTELCLRSQPRLFRTAMFKFFRLRQTAVYLRHCP